MADVTSRSTAETTRTGGDRKLIVNADDLGQSPEVTRAILDLWSEGRLSSASLMPTEEGFSEAASKAPRDLPVGVHLSLSSGHCVTPAREIPTLAREDGTYHCETGGMGALAKVDPGELRLEFAAQIARVESAGVSPTHLDNHQSLIYARPDLFAVVLELASARGLAVRFPFGENVGELAAPFLAQFSISRETLHEATMFLRAHARKLGVRTTSRFYQIPWKRSFAEKRAFVLNLLRTLAPGVTEICVHPGYDASWREDDVSLLRDAEVEAAIRAVGLSSWL